MKIFVALFSVTIILCVDDSVSLKCAPTACETVDCRPITECGPGQIKARGGHCLCCDVCKILVGENVKCVADSGIGGQLSDTVACGEGLLCYGETCQKTENVIGATLKS